MKNGNIEFNNANEELRMVAEKLLELAQRAEFQDTVQIISKMLVISQKYEEEQIPVFNEPITVTEKDNEHMDETNYPYPSYWRQKIAREYMTPIEDNTAEAQEYRLNRTISDQIIGDDY